MFLLLLSVVQFIVNSTSLHDLVCECLLHDPLYLREVDECTSFFKSAPLGVSPINE